jgi:hypothetical protein
MSTELFRTFAAAVYGPEMQERLERDAAHAAEQCLERALLCRAHEMHQLLRDFTDSYVYDPSAVALDRTFEAAEQLLAEIKEECK